jgi:hypothetical protein
MKKKMMFLFLLFPMVFGAANLYAQVTIGSDEEPHSGAILDLRSNNKGLKLPTVSLTDTAAFQLSTNPSDAASAIGMMVYNTNDNTKGGRGQGIYTWNGTWIYSGGTPKADIPVNRIVITSEGNVDTVKIGETLQLTDSIVPQNASNKKVAWSVPWSGSLTAGKAVVNDTGLVTGIKPGNVTVRASAIDGSEAFRDFALKVQPTGIATGISITSENGQYSVDMGRTLQLMAVVTPETASQNVTWRITSGYAAVTVSTTGVVTGNNEGSAGVSATIFGTSLSDTIAVSVSEWELPPGVETVTWPGGVYKTYAFNGVVWMINNSAEGSVTYRGFGDQEGVNAYYNQSDALTACPTGWRLPLPAEFHALCIWLRTYGTDDEKKLFFARDKMGFKNKDGMWNEVGNCAEWRVSTGSRYYVTALYDGEVSGDSELISVRCIKD